MFGQMSATRVQLIAMTSKQDHEGSPQLLVDLAGLGTNGKHPDNTHRDLVSLAHRRMPDVPKPLDFHIPMVYRQYKRGAGISLQSGAMHQMHAPYGWFSYLDKSKPESYRTRIVGGADGPTPDILEAFWNGVPELDPRKMH